MNIYDNKSTKQSERKRTEFLYISDLSNKFTLNFVHILYRYKYTTSDSEKYMICVTYIFREEILWQN